MKKSLVSDVAFRIHESCAVGCLGEFEAVVFAFRTQAVKQLLKLIVSD